MSDCGCGKNQCECVYTKTHNDPSHHCCCQKACEHLSIRKWSNQDLMNTALEPMHIQRKRCLLICRLNQIQHHQTLENEVNIPHALNKRNATSDNKTKNQNIQKCANPWAH